jgi:TM2 domain-containing membrane protein YozV
MKNLVARLSPQARAGILSFVIPGLGQVYLGRFGRGLIWFVGLVVVAQIAGADSAAQWIAPLIGAALAICSAVDAVIVANHATPRR